MLACSQRREPSESIAPSLTQFPAAYLLLKPKKAIREEYLSVIYINYNMETRTLQALTASQCIGELVGVASRSLSPLAGRKNDLQWVRDDRGACGMYVSHQAVTFVIFYYHVKRFRNLFPRDFQLSVRPVRLVAQSMEHYQTCVAGVPTFRRCDTLWDLSLVAFGDETGDLMKTFLTISRS